MKVKHVACRVYQWVYNMGEHLITWKVPQRLEGVDSFRSIVDVVANEQVCCPMVVTGPRIGKSDFLQGLVEELPAGTVVFCEVTPDPTVSQVEQIVELFEKHSCDCFIAVGGGSNMDAAKAAAARVARPDRTLQQLGGQLKVRRKIPLLIAVPTTAGTGSETTIAAVVTDDSCHRKYAINDPVLVPDYAVLDPNLTVTLSPQLTATTGMDALTHGVESYLNWTYQTEDTLKNAREAVAAILEFLPLAYQEGNNLEAREEMLVASFKAGEAFTRACVGNVHAIAHTIGGLYHVPHGLANAVALPYVLEDYGPAVYRKLAELEEFYESGTLSKEGGEAQLPEQTFDRDPYASYEKKAKKFINRIWLMNEDMELPKTLEIIREEDIPKMAKWADKEANPLYPVPKIYTPKEFEQLIRRIAGIE